MNVNVETFVEQRLAELKLQLPAIKAPVANYLSQKLVGNQLFISGQLCFDPSGVLAERHIGKLGANVSLEAGQEAARFCLLNVLAQVKGVLGSFDNLDQCVRLGGFINATPDYSAVPAVMNGASDLITALLGEQGWHTRSTVGVSVLPLNAAVEIEALFIARG